MLPPVLAYHLVDRRMDAGIAWITPKRFEKQIAWLAESGYRSLSLSEHLQCDHTAAEKRVVITFDDGYRSLLQYALPILSRYHFRATVFAIAGYVGRPNFWDVKFFLPRFHHLDWGGLRELMQAGWEIGSHSLNHDYLPALSEQQLRHDLVASRQILEDHLQTPVRHLSLPFGRGDQRVYQMAKAAGYESVSILGGGKPSIGNPQSKIINSKSQIVNPQSQIVNPQSQIVNPQSPIVNPKSQIVNPQSPIAIVSRRGVYLWDSMRSFRRRVEAPPDSQWQYWRQRAISAFALGTVMVKSVRRLAR
jgi:peptidoglycan/xylan/chitin deacetylase (PgdA/CDA1 family)